MAAITEMKKYYKFGHLNSQNQIKKIYVFVGSEQTTKNDLNTLFQKDPQNAVFAEIFTQDELKSIHVEKKEDNVSFIYGLQIHLDDTIETIKKKLLMQLQNENISFYELYLFAQQYEEIDTLTVYQQLTNNGKTDLTANILNQYLVNVQNAATATAETATAATAEKYTYADFLNFFPDKKKVLMNKPLGQKVLANKNFMNYPVNPYTIKAETSALFEKTIEKVISTTNHSLLLSFGEIENNLIYFCTANEVLLSNADKAERVQQAQRVQQVEQSIVNTNIVKIYFPFLIEINIGSDKVSIITPQDIVMYKETLMLKTEAMLENTGFRNTLKNIDLFYNVFYDSSSSAALPYSKKGAQNIEFIIYPPFEFSLPLDIIFKLIHATKEIPLIKYNPSKRMEKIYRLYANKIATNGKNIPYLSKAVIFNLMKTIGKHKCVTLYMELPAVAGTLLCIFESNGSIAVKADFNDILTVEQINAHITAAVNPVIHVVQEYIAQSGYQIVPFRDLYQPNIAIITMDYQIAIVIEKKLHLNKIVGCLNSIFSVSIADTENDAYTMRFKRVSNYNEMTDQEAFITDSLNHKHTNAEIIE